MNDVIIVGGGASGLMCAITIKKNNPKINVLLIEQNNKVGKKILKTGNGKCNISNSFINEDKYNDFSLIQKHLDINIENIFLDLGIAFKKDAQGRMYPHSETATSVLDCLYNNCIKLGVSIVVDTEVTNIDIDVSKNFIIRTNSLMIYKCTYLVVCTGSKAQEKTNGYKILTKLGHIPTKLTPALTYLKVKENIKPLQGLRVKCHCNEYDCDGELLFKENALSGIITLEISRYINEQKTISFNLVKDLEDTVINKLFDNGLLEGLSGILPKMIALDVFNRANKRKDKAKEILKYYSFTVFPPDDFTSAQITKGGIKVKEINSDFSSKIIDKLYIAGEVLDVDGTTGGYNLHFAWLSGYVAGINIAKRIK